MLSHFRRQGSHARNSEEFRAKALRFASLRFPRFAFVEQRLACQTLKIIGKVAQSLTPNNTGISEADNCPKTATLALDTFSGLCYNTLTTLNAGRPQPLSCFFLCGCTTCYGLCCLEDFMYPSRFVSAPRRFCAPSFLRPVVSAPHCFCAPLFLRPIVSASDCKPLACCP